uniref:Myoglobin n=1 Tax=Callorhinchus milii TaxID=7868 RepID=V9LEU4_CALMI
MTGITEADKENIHFIWEKLYENPEENGRTIVLRMFTDYPETKMYFQHFKNISTLEEMKKSPQIKRHGKIVMSALNKLIANLDNGEELSSLLAKMAERHINVHKVDLHNFQIIFNIIIAILEETFGNAFTPEIRGTWTKLFGVIYACLESHYKDAGFYP